jgi:hypothetical protein
MSFLFSLATLDEWLAITGALAAALSPLYWLTLKNTGAIARIDQKTDDIKAYQEGCPYCNREFEANIGGIK